MASSAKTNPVIPLSIDTMLNWPAMQLLQTEFGREPVLNVLRHTANDIRNSQISPDEASVASACRLALVARFAASQRRVFNLTGTVLHTNLGRALMAEEAIEAAVQAMRYPTTLEYELEAGRRGERDRHLEPLVIELTGAEAACAVNNNAAAVLLVLSALAKGKDVIVSRGELVEIGGSFRIPDIMKQAGCRLVEVGTTNRTHLADYEHAISAETALIMKVHTSNYAIQGFTASVNMADLVALGREKGVPIAEDLGSGTLIDLRRYGLPYEPTPGASLKAGVDLVTFSGDKLLGGPQAGFIAGRKDLVRRLAKYPMKRSLRLDKIRLAALEATLRLYADPQRLKNRVPTLRLLSRPADDIQAAASRVSTAIAAHMPDTVITDIAACKSQIGSGALPLDLMPSWALTIRQRQTSKTGKHKSSSSDYSLNEIAAKFRSTPVPVIGRIGEGRLWFDLRCLEPEDEPILINQFAALKL